MAVSATQIVEQNKEDTPEEESEAVETGNTGWANSIAKVLNSSKPKAKKTLVLSRAKKFKPEEQLKKIKSAKEEYGFEVDASGVVVEETDKKVKSTKVVDEEKDVKPKNLKLNLRVKPTFIDLERERSLRKVATKGVVQLFNAVRVQQKDLENQLEEAGPLDSKRDAVLKNIDKRKFLDVLMSGTRAKSEQVDGKVKEEEEEEEDSSSDSSMEDDVPDGTLRKKKNKWTVLDDNYLTSKKFKHYDDDEEEADDANYSATDDE